MQLTHSANNVFHICVFLTRLTERVTQYIATGLSRAEFPPIETSDRYKVLTSYSEDSGSESGLQGFIFSSHPTGTLSR